MARECEGCASAHRHVRHLPVGQRRAWAANQGPVLPIPPCSCSELKHSKYLTFDPGFPVYYTVSLSK